MLDEWSRDSWRAHKAFQQPAWPDKNVVTEVLHKINRLPALVFAGESRSLKLELAEAARGEAFVLQAGDCAEDFSRCHGPSIHNLLKVILQMSVILTYASEKKIIKVGRVAGQYAKPRSSDSETIDDVVLPVYRGDMVNSQEQLFSARVPDPERMLEGYFRSTATLNLIRAFTSGGYAALSCVQSWSEETYNTFTENEKYEKLVNGLKKTINFINAVGIGDASQLKYVSLYTSHEALLLEYEEAMTRIDTTTGNWYDTSAHMLWIGDRTRQIDGAHVEFLRGVYNPIGIKVGPSYSMDEIKQLIRKLNPLNEKGRLSIITRFGFRQIDNLLPPLLNGVKSEGFEVTWICDPMHGNTYTNQNKQKTRKYEHIISEIKSFFMCHKIAGTVPGGVHLELTGDHVTECSGGMRLLHEDNLTSNYQTSCDPRLNAEQAIELAFELAEVLQNHAR